MNREQLVAKLSEPEYRHAFVSSLISSGLANQIRLLRKKRGWDQSELGNRAGMKQAAVSRLENPNYGNLSVKTLKRLAEAFDVALIVRFATFGEIVDWATSLSESRLTPAEFSADRSLDIILDYTEDRILHDQIIIRDRTGAAEKQVDPVLTPSRHIEPGTASLANIA